MRRGTPVRQNASQDLISPFVSERIFISLSAEVQGERRVLQGWDQAARRVLEWEGVSGRTSPPQSACGCRDKLPQTGRLASVEVRLRVPETRSGGVGRATCSQEARGSFPPPPGATGSRWSAGPPPSALSRSSRGFLLSPVSHQDVYCRTSGLLDRLG